MVMISTTGAAKLVAIVGEMLLGIASKTSDFTLSIVFMFSGSRVHRVEAVDLLHLRSVSLHLCSNSFVDHDVHFFL